MTPVSSSQSLSQPLSDKKTNVNPNDSPAIQPEIQPEIQPSINNHPINWQIKLLYDGACPLCLREVNFLRKKDAGRGVVAFVDIADPSYAPDENGGVDFETAMGRIHAVLPDNTVIKNVEVFRQIYTLLGIGWLYAPTKWPVVGPMVDALYDFWADRRLVWTGRPPLKALVAERQVRLQTSYDESNCDELNDDGTSCCCLPSTD